MVRINLTAKILLALLTLGGITTTPCLIQPAFAATEIKSPDTQDLLLQGRIAYQAGRYNEAKTIWQEANLHHLRKNNRLDRALSLNYLALTSHKLGEWQQATTYIAESLKLLKQEPVTAKSLQLTAQALNTQGRLYLTEGKAEAALSSWQQATEIYRQAGDDIGALGSQINQGQAWQSLGLYRRSQKLLRKIGSKLAKKDDMTLKITGFRSLGLALQVTGDLQYALKMLQKSLAISQRLNLPEESSATLFSLGNTALALEDHQQAISWYEQAATATSQPLLKIEARLNQLNLLIANQQWQQVNSLLPEIQFAVANLSTNPSRRGIYARVNLAKSLIKLSSSQNNFNNEQLNETKNLLKTSLQQAQKLQDTKAESYAVGTLGYLYEQQQQWSPGRKYTQQAVQLAQVIDAPELTYQWQWQLGRLLKTQGNHSGAIASYTEAVAALESLRGDLIVTNTDAQFSFRESVEPVYRELVSLLLKPPAGKSVSQNHLAQARNTIESLQLAELNNFFREACLDAEPTSIDAIDRKAAVIYPIILSDRLEVVVSLPDKSLRHYSHAIPQAELEPIIEEFRQTIQIRSRRRYYQSSSKLYDWLIRPALKDLAAHKIETLVFIPDGTLRNIPVAALHDGKQYLIEQYNVALTPGLQLLSPLPLEQIELKALAAGITQQRRGLSSLEYVNYELQNIENLTNSFVLRDEEFTQDALREKIKLAQYPIVHIATHGQFSSNLDDTYLLAWDDDIKIEQLDDLLKNTDPNKQNAIELLILSACETATGDERAALGLAGMAVKAGARTTLATLWTVYDQSTALAMNSFYEHIAKPKTKVNKANALRQSQLGLINSRYFNHPYYWAPFVMVGNWL